MVDEAQRQRQMMFTDPNKQHYGPAGGPNKWDMDYPSGGMPTNYQGNSPHFRSGNLDVRYPGDYAHQQNQGRPNVSGPAGGPRTFRNTYPVTDFYGPPSDAEEMYWQGGPKQHPNRRMRGMGGGLESLESKIDLQDIFRKYPGLDMWQLIQNLDKRGIEYVNRGGIMGVI